MRISFDIDNTLIPFLGEFEQEEPTSLLRIFTKEKLRKGTVHLFENLEKQGHEIWIYTTSYRSKWKLKLTFAKYGLYPKGFINQQVNERVLREHNCYSSKNPRLFNIDLHIDDLPGVKLEAHKYHFKAFIVSPDNECWTQDVLNEVGGY